MTQIHLLYENANTGIVESKSGEGGEFAFALPASQESPAPEPPTAFGYEVQSARDGAEAIALCEETAAILKELDTSVKLIVSSGYSDAPAMSKFREYGG